MPPICRKPPDSALPPTAPAQLTVAYAWKGTDTGGLPIADAGTCQLFRTAPGPGIQYQGHSLTNGRPTTITLQGQPNDDNYSITATLQSATYIFHTATWQFTWRNSKHSNYYGEQQTTNPYEDITFTITILKAAPEKAPNEL